MDLKQLKEIDPNLLKVIIFEEFLKIDMENLGFINRSNIFERYGEESKILADFFLQKKGTINFKQFEKRFLLAIEIS